MPDTPAAAPRVNGLIERLGTLSESAVITEFALERISRDARALMRADPAGANTVLGYVAALRGDLETSQRHHQTALRIDRDFTHQFNYSISLSHLEENDESLEVACDALRAYPDSLELISHAIATAIDAGNFTTARELCDQWDALSQEGRIRWLHERGNWRQGATHSCSASKGPAKSCVSFRMCNGPRVCGRLTW